MMIQESNEWRRMIALSHGFVIPLIVRYLVLLIIVNLFYGKGNISLIFEVYKAFYQLEKQGLSWHIL